MVYRFLMSLNYLLSVYVCIHYTDISANFVNE